MAEEKNEDGSQTEAPTERKIQKAEEKGNLPFSRELPIFMGFVAYSLIASFIAWPSFSKLTSFLNQWLERPEAWRINNAEDIKNLLITIEGNVGLALLPILLLITLIGIASSLLQNPPRMIGERIRPQWSRISPSSGFKRIFGKGGWVEFGKSLAKILGVNLVVYWLFFRHTHIFLDALNTNTFSLPRYIQIKLTRLLLSFSTAVAVIAAFDLVWSRFYWYQQLRMSKQELKDEYKETEGDPAVKARMRSLVRSRIRQQMIANVPSATLIVVNPTHFAVALRYHPADDAAPVVVAKGKNIFALKIREIGIENNIPVIQNIELTQALYRQVEVNQAIPPHFYEAVAALIRFLNNQNNFINM